MPTQEKRLVAITAADLHLSGKPPLFRSNEEDWLKTQRDYLLQLDNLCCIATIKNPLGFFGGKDEDDYVDVRVPCLIPGDIFDKWNVSHETVNLALGSLPRKTIGVPGNHDLPNHRLEEMGRSAYGVLVEAGRITNLKPNEPLVLEGACPIRLHGFPYGVELKPLEKPNDFYLEIALVHTYIWNRDTGYPGAPEEQRLSAYKDKFHGYDVVLFGDNHKPLQWNLDRDKPGPSVLNCGGFMVRKSDERNHRPSVGLIYSDGTIARHYLDINQDKYLDAEELVTTLDSIGGAGFIESLLELGDCALNFGETIKRLLDREKVNSRVKDLILKALETGDG